MITAADIILKFAQFLHGRRDIVKVQQRDQVDRAATYLERISTCLLEASKSFEEKKEPWEQIGELCQHLRGLLSIVQPVVGSAEAAMDLWGRLRTAYDADMFLSAFALGRYLPPEHEPLRLSDHLPERERLIADEINKIKLTSGIFKAIASQLRATPKT